MNTVEDRFREKITIDHIRGCWLWMAAIDECGYGRFRHAGKWGGAHRASYELFVCDIPVGLEIDHKCRVRNCVNPEHLDLVTRSENCLRGSEHGTFGKKNKRKTHCANGHEYNEENTYLAPNGWRQCNICRSGYMKRYYQQHRAEWNCR